MYALMSTDIHSEAMHSIPLSLLGWPRIMSHGVLASFLAVADALSPLQEVPVLETYSSIQFPYFSRQSELLLP